SQAAVVTAIGIASICLTELESDWRGRACTWKGVQQFLLKRVQSSSANRTLELKLIEQHEITRNEAVCAEHNALRFVRAAIADQVPPPALAVIRHVKRAARLQDARQFGQSLVVIDQEDDAVTEHGIEALIGERQRFDRSDLGADPAAKILFHPGRDAD